MLIKSHPGSSVFVVMFCICLGFLQQRVLSPFLSKLFKSRKWFSVIRSQNAVMDHCKLFFLFFNIFLSLLCFFQQIFHMYIPKCFDVFQTLLSWSEKKIMKTKIAPIPIPVSVPILSIIWHEYRYSPKCYVPRPIPKVLPPPTSGWLLQGFLGTYRPLEVSPMCPVPGHAHLIVPGARSEQVQLLNSGGRLWEPPGLIDRLRHKLGFDVLHDKNHSQYMECQILSRL